MSIDIQNRRAFLKAGSTILALPLLDSICEAQAAAPNPKRALFIGFGFGCTEDTFFPTEAGRFSDIGMTQGMAPLKRHQNDITMVSNLTNHGASHPHSGSTSYLTGANVYNTPGKKFHNSVSVDQLVARKIGQDTRYPTLTLSDSATQDGHGAGLSLAWSDKGHPIPGITTPIDLYAQLFGQAKESSQEREFRLAQKRSILDGVTSDFKSTKRKLSKNDQDKLEDYFQSVRQIEQNISREVEWAETPKPKSPLREPGEGMDGLRAVKTMHSLIVAAFQTDSTRVITFRQPIGSVLLGHGLNLNPHSLSHYGLDPKRREVSQVKDRLFMELLASLIDQFKSKQDLNGQNLFESSLISYGSNLRSGHGIRGCPAIYTGGAAEKLKRGEHIVLPEQDTPLANYWLTLMQQIGVPLEQFSHSTGTLDEMVS
ncbi:MAG: DUF1552 domain-containing protein [Verrucomicrobiales bacterium]|nr:DUF1552 domain-containing protein [Verrucomicrobiales bacterium]